MRIFMGLQEISGNYSYLCKEIRKLGYECDFISIDPHPYQYDECNKSHLVEFYRKCLIVLNKKENFVGKLLLRFIRELVLLTLFISSLKKYDTYFFSSGSTFMIKNLDLIILKLFKKKIIIQYHGSDSRPPYINGKFVKLNLGKEEKKKYILNKSYKLSRDIKRIEKLADHIISMPTHTHFHSKKIINRMLIGHAIEIKSIFIPKKRYDDRIVILHAPSDKNAKGSKEIKNIISRLSEKYNFIEYKEISGITNDELLREIKNCDLVIDQLYSDYPFPRLSTEALLLGKPSIVAGYSTSFWQEYSKNKLIPPSLFMEPDEVEYYIEKVINDRGYFNNTVVSAIKFIEENWKIESVTKRYLQIMKGDVPLEWLYDPSNLDYIHGCGVSEEELIASLKETLDNEKEISKKLRLKNDSKTYKKIKELIER